MTQLTEGVRPPPAVTVAVMLCTKGIAATLPIIGVVTIVVLPAGNDRMGIK